MTTTLELSIISAFPLGQILQPFTKQTGHPVNVRNHSWETAWPEIIREAIYRNPMDVSEVGSSWISDLRTMGVLHAFSVDEIKSIEGSDAFLPASWENCTSPLDNQVWSIPWTLDTRFIYYRRDLLEKAGINPATAFTSHEAMKATLQALIDAGVPNPLALPTHRTRQIIHQVASWVWGSGGDFINADATTALFTHPEALQGFCQYYELVRFMSPETRGIEAWQSELMYHHGDAAVTISGPWLLHQADARNDVRSQTEFTFPPGVPFIGGTSLILWQQSTDSQAALELLRFLASVSFQSTYFNTLGYLPSRLAAISSPPFSSDPRFQFLASRLQQGRSFKPMPFWGWMEERLTNAMRQVWDEIILSPESDPRPIVEKYLFELERRVSMTLKQQF